MQVHSAPRARHGRTRCGARLRSPWRARRRRGIRIRCAHRAARRRCPRCAARPRKERERSSPCPARSTSSSWRREPRGRSRGAERELARDRERGWRRTRTCAAHRAWRGRLRAGCAERSACPAAPRAVAVSRTSRSAAAEREARPPARSRRARVRRRRGSRARVEGFGRGTWGARLLSPETPLRRVHRRVAAGARSTPGQRFLGCAGAQDFPGDRPVVRGAACGGARAGVGP